MFSVERKYTHEKGGVDAFGARISIFQSVRHSEIYVCDYDNKRICVLNRETQTMKALLYTTREPVAGCVYGSDILFLADHGLYSVSSLSTDMQPRRLNAKESGSSSGPLQSTGFNNPTSIIVDGDIIWIADTGNHRIVIIKDNMSSTLCGSCTPGRARSSNPLQNSFTYPTGLCLIDDSTLAVCDRDSDRISMFGRFSGRYLGDICELNKHLIRSPISLIWTSYGFVSISRDNSYLVLHKLDTKNSENLIGGNCSYGTTHGPRDSTRFYNPTCVLNMGDSLFVVQKGNMITEIVGLDIDEKNKIEAKKREYVIEFNKWLSVCPVYKDVEMKCTMCKENKATYVMIPLNNDLKDVHNICTACKRCMSVDKRDNSTLSSPAAVRHIDNSTLVRPVPASAPPLPMPSLPVLPTLVGSREGVKQKATDVDEA